MSKLIYILLLALIAPNGLSARVYSSIQKGQWSDPYIWANAEAPGNQTGDTVIIRHYIDVRSDLFMNSGAHLKIDSSGGLCGHISLTVYQNASFYKNGSLQIDSLFVKGGYVIFDGPGAAILYRQASLTLSGAYMRVKGGSFEVGPWFNCTTRPSETGLSRPENSFVSVYPNPANGIVRIGCGQESAASVSVYAANGQMVHAELQTNEKNTAFIDLSHHAPGLYTIAITLSSGAQYTCLLRLGD